MLFATVDQGQVFLLMCAAGAVIRGWYGVCRLVRRLLEAGPVLSLLADAAFGLGAAGILAAASVAANYGQLRLYMLLAAALGAGLAELALAPAARAAGRALRRLWRRARAHRIIKVIIK